MAGATMCSGCSPRICIKVLAQIRLHDLQSRNLQRPVQLDLSVAIDFDLATSCAFACRQMLTTVAAASSAVFVRWTTRRAPRATFRKVSRCRSRLAIVDVRICRPRSRSPQCRRPLPSAKPAVSKTTRARRQCRYARWSSWRAARAVGGNQSRRHRAPRPWLGANARTAGSAARAPVSCIRSRGRRNEST